MGSLSMTQRHGSFDHAFAAVILISTLAILSFHRNARSVTEPKLGNEWGQQNHVFHIGKIYLMYTVFHVPSSS